MKNYQLVLATALLTIPATAYAVSMFPVRVIVGGYPTKFRALVIDSTAYVSLRDVSSMTGRKVKYDGATRIVNISDANGSFIAPKPVITEDDSMNNSGDTVGIGGTSQRAGLEGKAGQLLVAPTVALRINKIETSDDNKWVYLVGDIRNPSSKAQGYNLKDAVLIDKAGATVKYALTAQELNGRSGVMLQSGEQGQLKIRFRGVGQEYERAVVTIRSDKKEVVFRATF